MKTHLLIYSMILISISGCTSHRGGKGETDRQSIINGIDGFKKAIATKDTTKIAPFISRDALNSAYIEEYSVVIDNFTQLFSNLDISKLATSDTVAKIVPIKGEPCIMNYSIDVGIEDTITFYFIEDSEPNYAAKHDTTSDGIDLSSYCEHDAWWVFKAENGVLKFISAGGAD